jgi:hypothetical protein
MTASYAQQFALGQDTALRARVVPAIIHLSNYVLAGGGSQTEASKALASGIVRGGVEPVVALFARQIADNGTAQGQAVFSVQNGQVAVDTSGITDNTIDSVVGAASVWNVIAGG